jgi:FKBP-type peptidyl-prolyl cis-trans isomerase
MNKKILLVIVLFLFLVIFSGCSSDKSEKNENVNLKTRAEKESYLLGIDMVKDYEQLGEGFSPEAFLQGVNDYVNKKPYLISDTEMEVIRKRSMDENNAARSYMSENMKNPGVKSTRSGLQYMVISEGTGDMPVLNDKVKIHYSGSLVNGKEFENTFKSGNAAVFRLNNTMKGFEEAIQMMKAGSRYKLFIPPNLGYGKSGKGEIPPNSVLIYEVELLEIIK